MFSMKAWPFLPASTRSPNEPLWRVIIENSIQDGIDFFHMDALSSTVPMKVNFDL
jgi:hypothetical protein